MSSLPRTLARFAPLFLAGLVVPGPSAHAQETDASVEGVRTPALIPGDAIRVSMPEEPDASGTFEVDETGSVTLPFLEPRTVTGVPADELKRELREAYGRQFTTPVQVVLLRRIRVLGEVRNPGLFQVDPTLTLADVIALAGGTTADADDSELRILRAGHETTWSMEGAASAEQVLQSGDQLLVPKRSWASRNEGVLIGALVTGATILLSAALF